MAHPEIIPGLKVRYRETGVLIPSWGGEVRIVTRVHDGGVEGVGVVDGDRHERTLVGVGDFKFRFWTLFELVEDEPTEGDAKDDGAGGVWVTTHQIGAQDQEPVVDSIHDDELSAYRAMDLSRISPRVTFVEYGSDVKDVVMAIHFPSPIR